MSTIDRIRTFFGFSGSGTNVEPGYEDMRAEVSHLRPELRFLRTGPCSSINDAGDTLELVWDTHVAKYDKADGRTLSWRIDVMNYKDTITFMVYLPYHPGWLNSEPFSSEELELVKDEVRMGMNAIEATFVLFYDKAYMKWLNELEPERSEDNEEQQH